MINYISNLDPSDHSGGWNGINHQLFKHLQSLEELNFCGPVVVPVNKIEKGLSHFQKTFSGKSNFYFFSENRLLRIAQKVNTLRNTNVSADFFFGQTSWIKCSLPKPYFVYMDLAFPDYLANYIGAEKFQATDIERIVKDEKNFLDNAAAVFITSNWARINAIEKLKLENVSNHHVVRVAGNVPIPDTDVYSFQQNQPSLLFISLNFEKKGGMICFQAFTQIQERIPGTILNIIGEKPPEEVLNHDGVKYHGRLNKNVQVEFDRFISVLGNASFLIHPTRMDATPTVIAEAGYFGCPAIAPSSFGIPDLIDDNVTGYLLHTTDHSSEIASKVLKIFADQSKYLQMRYDCRAFATEQLSWSAIANKIHSTMRGLLHG